MLQDINMEEENRDQEGSHGRCDKSVKWQLHLNLATVSFLQLPLAILFATPISSLYLFITSNTTPSINNTEENDNVDWNGLGQSDTFYSWVVTIHGIGILVAALVVMLVPFLLVFRVLLPFCLLIPIASGVLYANSTTGWMISIAHFLLGVSFGVLEVSLVSYISVTSSRLTDFKDQVNSSFKGKKVFSVKDKYLAATLVLRTIGWPIGLGISSLMAQYEQTVDQFRWPGWANSIIVTLYAFIFLVLFRNVRMPNEKLSSNRRISLKNMASLFKGFCKNTTFRQVMVLLYLAFSAHVMASMGSILGTMVPPILSDHFGFTITFISYFTLGVMGTSFIGGVILIALKCLRVNNRRVFFVVLIFGVTGGILASDWQAIGSDSCRLDSIDNNEGLVQSNDTHQAHRYLGELCVSQNGSCYWNQDALLTGTHCFLCRSVCRSKTMTISIIQFCIGVVIIHLSALIGWTTIVSIATDCTATGSQSAVVGFLFVMAGVAWLVTPLWSISIYNALGKRTFAPLSVWNVLQLLSLCGLGGLYKHLGPVKSIPKHDTREMRVTCS